LKKTPMEHPSPFIYLASASPRRQALLEQAGIRFRLLLADESEDVESLEHIRRGESPTTYVERVALAKAQAGLERMQRRELTPAPVLAADTTVAVGGTILSKPRDRTDAIRILTLLSGRTHRVLTAVVLVRSASRIERAITVSRVGFARLSRAEIESYVSTGEPLDKAGAYAIQGGAAAFVRRIEGSYTGIVGLPLHETLRLLRQAGRGSAP
jgi:septum formation protein